jgi:hypothetical protein
MGIGLHDYEALLDRLHAAQRRLEGYMSIIGWAAPAGVLLEEFAYQVETTLLDAPVVLRFWHNADGWTGVRAGVTGVVAGLSDGNPRRTIHDHWAGFAADNYYRIIPVHQAAANELGMVADKVQQALTWTAQSAYAFYVVVLAQTLVINAAMITASAELVTVVLAPAALVTLAAAAAAALASLAEGLAAAAAAYTWARVFVYNLRSELSNTAAFPEHTWPASKSSGYRDGTVTDGDAEWSLRHG